MLYMSVFLTKNADSMWVGGANNAVEKVLFAKYLLVGTWP